MLMIVIVGVAMLQWNKMVHQNVISATRPNPHGSEIHIPRPFSISYQSLISIQLQETTEVFKLDSNQPVIPTKKII